MKKLLVCVLAVLCLCCFVSCETTNHEHISEWKYDESTHWQVVTCTTNECDFNMPSPTNHIDENNDEKCDICGYNMPEHEHTWELTKDEFCHCIVYTCGCLTPSNATPHLDDDGDGLCDVCGYNTPEYEHTGEWVAYNQHYHYYEYTCGCSLPDKMEKHENNNANTFCDICGHSFTDGPIEIFFLKEYAGWLTELNAENVAEIKTTFEYVGVAPGSLKDITKTTDKTVIANLLKAYANVEMRTVARSETYIDGGSAFTIEFTLTDGTVNRLYFNNGFYTYGLEEDEISALCYFQLYTMPTLKDYDNVENSNGFITYIGKGTVYDKDNNPVGEISIDELEFVEFDGNVDAEVTGEYYTVETEFGTLRFPYSNYWFYQQFEDEDNSQKFYMLVGKNLDELLAE